VKVKAEKEKGRSVGVGFSKQSAVFDITTDVSDRREG